MALRPVVNGLETRYRGRIDIQRVDVEDPASRALMQQYRVPGTPYWVLLNRDGSLAQRRGGMRAADGIDAALEALLQ